MINCKPYNKTITDDLNTAYRAQDIHWFHREIRRLCKIVASRPNNFDNTVDYDHVTSRLQVCLAFADSFVRHGETTQLICDMVNF